MPPLDELEAVAQRLQAERAIATLAGIQQWYANPAAHVVVCGEFKRGKSTLVNALVGSDVCPTDALPATAVPALLHWSDAPQALVQYQTGRSEPIAPTAEALAALSVGGSVPAESVRFVSVGIPSPLLRDGLVLIDTPGVNDLSRQRADVTYRFLPMADAVLVVLDATAPVTRTEVAFLTDQVLPGTRDRLLFALGKVDRIEEEEVAEALAGAAGRLASVLGRSVNVIPVSSKRTLRGDASGCAALTAALARLVEGCTADRAERLQTRLLQVTDALLEDSHGRLRLLAASPADRAEATARVGVVSRELEEQFAGLRDYVRKYGETTLRDLVAASLVKVHRDLQEELLHQLATLQSGIPGYVQQQVPYRVAVRLRQWGEAKGPEIETFLTRFVERVSQDFSHRFAAPLELAGLPRGIATPVIAAETQSAASNRTQEVLVGRLLPVALPMAAGMLLFGPLGAVAGSLMGQLAATHIEESKVEEQRTEARSLIERELRTAIEGFQASVNGEIARWFERVSESLRTAMEHGRTRSLTLLADPREGERASLQAEIVQLNAIRATLSTGEPS